MAKKDKKEINPKKDIVTKSDFIKKWGGRRYALLSLDSKRPPIAGDSITVGSLIAVFKRK